MTPAGKLTSPLRLFSIKNDPMVSIYVKYLKIIVPLFALLILLIVLFAHGAAKETGMLLGIIGFVILLANLVNRSRLKKRQ
jgi:hypothetical protein